CAASCAPRRQGNIDSSHWCRASLPVTHSASAGRRRPGRKAPRMWPMPEPGGKDMFITKKHLSRRTLLRGLGVSLSLPLLDAMVPAGVALSQTAAAPRPRLGFFYFPHGAVMEKWTPQKTGRDFELNEITQALTPFRDQLTVVSNLGNKPGESRAVHALVPATWLSCVQPRETLEPYMAPTTDQIAAQHIGQDTPWPSIETATAQGQGTGSACERGYGC